MKIFGRSKKEVEEKPVTASQGSTVSVGSFPYTPGQKEPEEYVAYISEIAHNYEEAAPFSFPYTIIGVKDRAMAEKAISQKVVSNIKGKTQEVHYFERRNPVIVIKYPAVFNDPIRINDLFEDAKYFKKQGASDISVVGINLQMAERIRGLYGTASCPFIAVV